MTRRLWIGLGLLAAALAAGIPGGRALLGIRTVRPAAEPLAVDRTYPHEAFDRILRAVVSPSGFVHYDRLEAREADLRRYVATLGVAGPRTRPELFPEDRHALAWSINAYNAAVLLGVLEHRPLRSVRDVAGLVDPHPGFGFFYGLRFPLDGRKRDLHRFEQRDIRGFGDARIHAAVNCASAACPPLPAFAFTPGNLDRALEDAARRWVATPPHVAIDEAARRVRLSMIFSWYEEDFLADAEELGVPGVLGWIAHFSNARRAALLDRALKEAWAVEHVEYDWSLNDAGPGPMVGSGRVEDD